MMNYEEILMMIAVEPYAIMNVTPTFTSIVGYNNSQTHVDMLTYDIEKWAKDHDVKITVTKDTTLVGNAFYSDDDTACDTIHLYSEDGFVKMRIELFYH